MKDNENSHKPVEDAAPKGCTCASFFTVRSVHKPGCPAFEAAPTTEWEKEFVEAGAALEHARWSRWQEYIFDCALKSGDDNLGIRSFAWPTAQVEKWQHQIDTPYEELSETEKESDRREVREYVPLITALLAKEREKTRQQAFREVVEMISRHEQGDAHEHCEIEFCGWCERGVYNRALSDLKAAIEKLPA